MRFWMKEMSKFTRDWIQWSFASAASFIVIGGGLFLLLELQEAYPRLGLLAWGILVSIGIGLLPTLAGQIHDD